MATLSPKIRFYNKEKLEKINQDTMKLWNKYKIDMSLRELSLKTVDGYKSDLQQWWIYIYDNQNNKCVKDLDEDDITEFLYYCKEKGNNSRRMKRRMSSIAAFYKFLRKKRIITENPMEFLDRPKKDTDVITQTFLTQEQVDLIKSKLKGLIENSKSINKKHYALQIQCYALFSLSTMARVNAISNTRWDQLDWENRTVKDVLEKEGYIVDLFYSNEVSELLLNLQKFRKENKINDDGYVFTSTYGGKTGITTTGTLNQWCKVIGEMIGVSTLHCHDWRHSGATLLKNRGMELEEVSKLLHHSGTDVTSKFYIKMDTTKLQKNKDKFEI